MPRSIKPLDLVRLFAALADPTRLRLMNLMVGNEVCVCYFVEILSQPQPKISRHLAYLRNAGLVHVRRDGKWMHYSILQPTDPTVAAMFDSVLNHLQQNQQMQAERLRLTQSYCEPRAIVTITAPIRS